MWSPGFDEFIGVPCEYDWAVIAFNGKTMKGENKCWGGWQQDGSCRLLAGLCSLDLLLLVSSRVLLPLWALQRLEPVVWGWCLPDNVCSIPSVCAKYRPIWGVEPKNSSQVGFGMDLHGGGR